MPAVDHALNAPFARLDQARNGTTGCCPPLWPDRCLLALVALSGLPLLRAALLASSVSSFAACCLLARLLPRAAAARLLAASARACGRAALLGCALSVRTNGAPDPSASALVANHVSYLDILALFALVPAPSFVAKRSLAAVPVLGLLARSLGCVFVDRESGGGAAALVRDRCTTPPSRRPALLLFPEGTTTNGAFLLPFRRGAFLAGLPVQPVLLQYRWRRWCPAWETAPLVPHLAMLLLSPPGSLSVELRFLPTVAPSAEEAARPELFAAAVRARMLDAAGGWLAPSGLGLADKRAYHAALRAEATAGRG